MSSFILAPWRESIYLGSILSNRKKSVTVSVAESWARRIGKFQHRHVRPRLRSATSRAGTKARLLVNRECTQGPPLPDARTASSPPRSVPRVRSLPTCATGEPFRREAFGHATARRRRVAIGCLHPWPISGGRMTRRAPLFATFFRTHGQTLSARLIAPGIHRSRVAPPPCSAVPLSSIWSPL